MSEKRTVGQVDLLHDVDATNFGYALGEVPSSGCLYYVADEKLRKAAVEAVKNAAPEISVLEGRVASGDSFIRTKEKKDWIRNNFDADCCEMEGCAIAQASYLNSLPFVIIRAISDKADESVQESYDVFEGKAAEHCAKIVSYMLGTLIFGAEVAVGEIVAVILGYFLNKVFIKTKIFD